MAPATLRPKPRIPQFICHRRILIVHGPPIMRARFGAGLWCENIPSISMVQAMMQSIGKRQDMRPAMKGEMRSGSA
jgi:hypothetical protein